MSEKECTAPRIKCDNCGTVFYLDTENSPCHPVSPEWEIRGGRIVKAICPVCGTDCGEGDDDC